MLHAIHYADLVLIPVQPSNDDLKSCHSTARHVVQAGKSARRTIPYRIVISRASTGFRPEVEKVVEEALENANLPRLKTTVFERTAFKRASFSRIAPIFDQIRRGCCGKSEGFIPEVRDTLARDRRGGAGDRLNERQVGDAQILAPSTTNRPQMPAPPTPRPDLRVPPRRSEPRVDSLVRPGFVTEVRSRQPGANRAERGSHHRGPQAAEAGVCRPKSGERKDDPDRRTVASMKSVILEALSGLWV